LDKAERKKIYTGIDFLDQRRINKMLQSQIIARLQARQSVIKLAMNWVGFLVFFALAGNFALNLILPC
jgi:hypothetical protein